MKVLRQRRTTPGLVPILYAISLVIIVVGGAFAPTTIFHSNSNHLTTTNTDVIEMQPMITITKTTPTPLAVAIAALQRRQSVTTWQLYAEKEKHEEMIKTSSSASITPVLPYPKGGGSTSPSYDTITTWKPELYNTKHSFVYNYGMSLVSLLDPKENERILDLGCGSGQLTFEIDKLARETIGIDKSVAMIIDAKSKFPSIEFQVADASNFNFEEKFDSIFSNAALHWMKDYRNAIKSMFHNLKPGGKIVVEFGGKGNVQTIVKALRNSLRTRGYIEQSDLDIWYFPSIGEYSTELESAGFRVLFAEHYDRPTELADESSGIKDWISMFGESFFTGVAEYHIEEIKNEVQENVKENCLIDGKWFADYKRIRIIAIKE